MPHGRSRRVLPVRDQRPGAPTAGHGADCLSYPPLGCPSSRRRRPFFCVWCVRLVVHRGRSPTQSLMDRLIVALWVLALALVGLGILAVFMGWLLPDG